MQRINNHRRGPTLTVLFLCWAAACLGLPATGAAPDAPASPTTAGRSPAPPGDPSPPPEGQRTVPVANPEKSDAPAPAQPANPFYLQSPMRPGDLVRVALREDETVSFDGEISAAGLIFLSYLGKFAIAGMTEAEAEKALEEALTADLYEKAHVSVTINKRAAGQVYIYGAVKAPGRIELPEFGEKNILQAIAEAGGVTTWASLDNAYILRTVPGARARTKMPVDLSRAFEDIEARHNLALRDNDIIFIPTSTGFDSVLSNEAVEIFVTGQISNPGVVAFKPGEQRTFLRAIFKAGSFTRFAKKKSVRLVRYQPDGTRTVTTIDAERMIDEGFLDEDVDVQPGDLIIVDEKRINF